MAEVVEIDDYRPHVVIDSRVFDGRIHVVPESCIEDYALGRTKYTPSEPELRRIVADWLCCLRLGIVEDAVGAFSDDMEAG